MSGCNNFTFSVQFRKTVTDLFVQNVPLKTIACCWYNLSTGNSSLDLSFLVRFAVAYRKFLSHSLGTNRIICHIIVRNGDSNTMGFSCSNVGAKIIYPFARVGHTTSHLYFIIEF